MKMPNCLKNYLLKDAKKGAAQHHELHESKRRYLNQMESIGSDMMLQLIFILLLS